MTDKTEHAVKAVSGVSSVLREVTRERDELRAENERLRAALEAIIVKGQKGDYMERAPLVEIALEALGNAKGVT
jgi:regulator of replication initiation timing